MIEVAIMTAPAKSQGTRAEFVPRHVNQAHQRYRSEQHEQTLNRLVDSMRMEISAR